MSGTYNKKQVVQKDINTKEVINIFDSLSDASKYIKASSSSHISNCCNNKIESAYGYIWEFVS